MLISPLMGPIIGIGFSVGINHPEMLKLSVKNYAFASIIGLVTSTVYFFITPLSEAHSEILARTSPNIYDVFIAFFGGAAGMLANGTKTKGNVIPGVAIATALMPPLCTAGYGIATGQFKFFSGALYLYIINTVYIAVSTFLVVKLLNFPAFHFASNEKNEKRSRKIMWVLIIITFVPSVYFGYIMIKKNAFEHTANNFITNEAIFPNNFLLQKNISYEKKEIQLTYGGQKLEDSEIDKMKKRTSIYGLDSVKIVVNQGFNFTTPTATTEPTLASTQTSIDKDNLAKMMAFQDSISTEQQLTSQVFKELKTQGIGVDGFTIGYLLQDDNDKSKKTKMILVETDKRLSEEKRKDLENYLKVRIQNDSVRIVISTMPKAK